MVLARLPSKRHLHHDCRQPLPGGRQRNHHRMGKAQEGPFRWVRERNKRQRSDCFFDGQHFDGRETDVHGADRQLRTVHAANPD